MMVITNQQRGLCDVSFVSEANVPWVSSEETYSFLVSRPLSPRLASLDLNSVLPQSHAADLHLTIRFLGCPLIFSNSFAPARKLKVNAYCFS